MYDLCITVDFQDYLDNDTLLLNKVYEEDTIFEGNLMKQKTRVNAIFDDPLNMDNVKVRLPFHYIIFKENVIILCVEAFHGEHIMSFSFCRLL